MNNPAPKVWFITGCSAGFGKEMAQLLLERGDHVAATARNPDTLADLKPSKGQLLPLALDITDKKAVEQRVAETIQTFGRIDVLVNNAGYGLLSAVEEATEQEIRDQFETNVFGTLHVTRAVLPQMRKQRSGHILALSSIAGQAATPGFSYYNGSKFALEGIFEGLSQELAPLGVHVTIVEPGGFRTKFAGTSLKIAAEIADYAQSSGKTRQMFENMDGNQAGDPVKGAQAMIQIADTENPPLRLVLGVGAMKRVRGRLEATLQEWEAWKDLSYSTEAQ